MGVSLSWLKKISEAPGLASMKDVRLMASELVKRREAERAKQEVEIAPGIFYTREELRERGER